MSRAWHNVTRGTFRPRALPLIPPDPSVLPIPQEREFQVPVKEEPTRKNSRITSDLAVRKS